MIQDLVIDLPRPAEFGRFCLAEYSSPGSCDILVRDVALRFDAGSLRESQVSHAFAEVWRQVKHSFTRGVFGSLDCHGLRVSSFDSFRPGLFNEMHNTGCGACRNVLTN